MSEKCSTETTIDQQILAALERFNDRTGAQLSEMVGLWSGSLYPALYRLERDGKIIGSWEDMPYPRRRRYRMKERACG